MAGIPHFADIDEYNLRINITPPRFPHFDVRSFEENMKTVRLRMEPFRIPFFQIALLESGGGSVKSDGYAYDLDNCVLFFNLPGQVIQWDVSRDWRGYYCCIDAAFYTVRPDGYPRLFDFPFFRAYTPGIKLIRQEARILLDLFARLHLECHNPDGRTILILKSELAVLLSYCARYHDRQVGDDRAAASATSLGNRFKRVVHDRLTARLSGADDAELSPSACAASLYISPKYLSEIIRRELGCTPTEYIHRQLIGEARKMIVTGAASISEIAYRLGFRDAAYFSRVFKKVTGMAPSRYSGI